MLCIESLILFVIYSFLSMNVPVVFRVLILVYIPISVYYSAYGQFEESSITVSVSYSDLK